MTSCIILGDSIAVGTGWAMPQCTTRAQKGISSINFNRKWLKTYSDRKVIISLGTNDKSLSSDDAEQTKIELIKLRRNIISNDVTWLIPAIKPLTRNAVYNVAYMFGDKTIDLLNISLSRDGIHPTIKGYHSLANMLR